MISAIFYFYYRVHPFPKNISMVMSVMYSKICNPVKSFIVDSMTLNEK